MIQTVDSYKKTFQKKINKFADDIGLSEIGGGLLLLLATCVSLILANSSIASSYIGFWNIPMTIGVGENVISMTLRDWINDGLMSLFFFVVALEIRKEIFFGSLRSFKKAILPIVAAVGGMVVPALIYFLINKDTASFNGWGIPTATDIAFAVGVLTIFRKRVPKVMLIFLLTLAIADDMGAIIIIACFYGKKLHMTYLLLAGLVTSVLVLMGMFKVYRGHYYFLIGALLWFCLFKSGVNPDIAGVVTAFCVPVLSKIRARGYLKNIERLSDQFISSDAEGSPQYPISEQQERVLQNMKTEIKNVYSPLQRLTARWHNFSIFFVMPLFAMANTAMPIFCNDFLSIGRETASIGIMAGLFLGKPIGIAGFSFLAVKLKLAQLPAKLTWRNLVIAGMVGGIGFTMSLFVADLSFYNNPFVLKISKLSILVASVVSTLSATIVILLSPSHRESGS
jgi:Na+:H+ antiporter, NhaA family